MKGEIGTPGRVFHVGDVPHIKRMLPKWQRLIIQAHRQNMEDQQFRKLFSKKIQLAHARTVTKNRKQKVSLAKLDWID